MTKSIFITAAILLLTTTQSLSQVNVLEIPKETMVGKAVKSFNKIAELSYSTHKADTIYTLGFEDYRYKLINNWVSIFFKATTSEIDGLHQALKDLIGDNAGSDKALQLGGYKCIAKSTKTLGIKQLLILFYDKNGVSTGLMILEKKHIDSLFGK